MNVGGFFMIFFEGLSDLKDDEMIVVWSRVWERREEY